MAVKDSLRRSMDLAVKHYASLFRLPSYRQAILGQALVCLCCGLASTPMIYSGFDKVVDGLAIGASLFAFSFALDYAISKSALRRDPIYNSRRAGLVSLFCWGSWFCFILLGDLVAWLTSQGAWGIRLCLLGFSSVLVFRLVVFNATSGLSRGRLFVASLVPPFFSLSPFVVLWIVGGYLAPLPLCAYLLFASVVAIVSAFFFLYRIDRLGKEVVGSSSLAMFKSFLLDWVEDLNAPFEELLERLGHEQTVKLYLVKFDSGKTRTLIVVPSVHPGPFKNIGSSMLPSLLKARLEEKLGAIACVPHGLFGHELDLASQAQTEKVIDKVVESASFEAVCSDASPFVSVRNDSATACCQVFGDFAFLSVTLAPKTTEDLPEELGMFIRQKAERLGLTCCVVVNAHNSINDENATSEELNSLKRAAAASLEEAVSLVRQPIEVGACTVVPDEFGPKEGMGLGGITALVAKVGAQRTAYIVIDGNNMVSGLREKIMVALDLIGIDASEVFTTDTHSVTAVVLGKRGYNPVGEVIEHDKLIEYVKKATLAAASKLALVRSGCRHVSVYGIKVIGEDRLETLSVLTDRCLGEAKRILVPVFGLCGLVLMMFLLLI